MTPSEDTPLLQVRALSKQFGGAHALSAVDLDIHRGEVHGLVGANGAGKSTLIRCLAGVTRPDSGELLIDGEPVDITSPQDAERAGFAFIHQELNLVPHFNAIQNILLGVKKPSTLGIVRWGIATARRAWLTADQVANTRPWPEFAALRKRAAA